MEQTEMVGKAQTVLGLLDSDSFDVTLPHEHFLYGNFFWREIHDKGK
ncbi:unnamed protein product [marine sediment metagenome]|uniref:Uncharacterized protein n=1 Tax=marine sediment metagenome TaxID=412755 RepID=X1T2U0_9ZZZZ